MTSPAIFSKMRVLAARLIASSNGGADHWEEMEGLSKDECAALDAMVFECARCNQWFAQSDNATKDGSEWVCRDCSDGGA